MGYYRTGRGMPRPTDSVGARSLERTHHVADHIYRVTCTECDFEDECHRGTDPDGQLDQELSCEERHRQHTPNCRGQLEYEQID